MAVAQDVYLMGPEGLRYRFRVHLKIVIAKHREDAEAGAKLAQGAGYRADISRGERDIISGERHEVRFELVGDMNGALNILQGRVQAVVDVRKVNDREPIMAARKPPQPDINIGDDRVLGGTARPSWRFRRIQRKSRQKLLLCVLSQFKPVCQSHTSLRAASRPWRKSSGSGTLKLVPQPFSNKLA